MKKNITSIKALAALLVAGAFTACSNDDNIANEQPVNPAQQTYTMTVNAVKGSNATTRALSFEGNALNATWATTENVYVYDYTLGTSGTWLSGTIKPQSNGVSTTLKGTLTSYGQIEKYHYLLLRYPRQFCNYTEQDGTLEKIATHYDFAEANAHVSEVKNNIITTEGTTEFTNKQAIVKFTLKDATTSEALNVTSLTISDGGTGLITQGITKGDLIITPAAATDVLYTALSGISGSELKLTATDGTSNYTYIKENVTFEHGKYYNVTIAMKKQVTYTLTSETAALAIPAGVHATITGTGGANTRVTIADGAIVTLDNADISAIPNTDSNKWAGLSCLGDATIILEGTNNVKGGYEDYPGIRVVTGKTLTIQGDGQLTATSGNGTNGYAAGIGAGYGMSCGNIVIKSGTIIAIGGSSASGIGCVQQGSTFESITISGGDITAYGGSNSSGIGSGPYSSNTSGNITISGGTITATGNRNSPGIGASEMGKCGNITISGGTIVARSGSDTSAGIGVGLSGLCGDIVIGNATVTASGISTAATIGSAYGGTCGDITIQSDTKKLVLSKSVIGSYIGKYSGSGTCGTVTIDGTNVGDGTSATIYEYSHFTSSWSGDTWTLTHK